MAAEHNDSFELYDLKVEAVAPPGVKVYSGAQPGDYFELKGEMLYLPPGQGFSIYSLSAVLPLLAAKQRETAPLDWMTSDEEIANPDPNCPVRLKITRTGKRTFRRADTTAVALPASASATTGVPRATLAPGYDISRLIKGGWHLSGDHGAIDRDQALKDMASFVEAGITTFDCADIYTGVEEMIGDFRAAYPALAKSVRVHTKFVPDLAALDRVDPALVESSIDRSLRRLKQESLDLVQFHWWNFEIPGYVEAALELARLQRAGKIQHIGVTNFDVPHLAELLDAGVRVLSHQVQYSVLDHRPEHGMDAFCQANDIAFLCYGTVAGGFLSERWLGKPGADRDLRQPLAGQVQAHHRGLRRLGAVPGPVACPGRCRRQTWLRHRDDRQRHRADPPQRGRRDRRRHQRRAPGRPSPGGHRDAGCRRPRPDPCRHRTAHRPTGRRVWPGARHRRPPRPHHEVRPAQVTR
nr:aldo/keto reductase [Pseudoxanthomonas winnipegensis]